MKTATKVRDLNGFGGIASLYKLSEPLDSYEYVIASSINDAWAIETFILGCNKNGGIIDGPNFPRLVAVIEGTDDHQVALNHAGYEEIVDLNLL